MKSPTSIHGHHHHYGSSSTIAHSTSGSNGIFPKYFQSLIGDGSTGGSSLLDLTSQTTLSGNSFMSSLSSVHSHSHNHNHHHHQHHHSHAAHLAHQHSPTTLQLMSQSAGSWPMPSSSSPLSATISPSYLYSSASQFQPSLSSDQSDSTDFLPSYHPLSSSASSSSSSSMPSESLSDVSNSGYLSNSPFAASLLHYFHQGIDHLNATLSGQPNLITSMQGIAGSNGQVISEAMASIQSAPPPPSSPIGDYFNNSTLSNSSELGLNMTLAGAATTTTTAKQYNELYLYTMRNVMLIFCYSLIVLVSLSGNLLVCRVTLGSKDMKTTTNLLIGSLACSDLVMTVFNIPFNLFRLLPISWPFGLAMCILVPLIQTTCVYVSTFTMTLIALHRFWTVRSKRSTHGKTSGLKVFLMIFTIWLISVTISLPHAAFNRVRTKYFEGHKLSRCMVQHPKMGFNFPLFLTLEVFVTQYLLPLSITMVVYIKIAQIIAKQGALICKLSDEKKRRQSEAKRRRIFMLALAVATFATCWAPIDIYFLLYDMKLVSFSEPIYILCHWFAMSSVCYNPIIYCWLNEKFRIGAKQAIRSICHLPMLNQLEKQHNSI